MTKSIVCEYESNPSRNEEVMAKVNVFYKLFDLEKGQPEGQCLVWVWWCKALMTRRIVCEYESNPSRNDEVLAKVKVFLQFLQVI